MTHSSGNGSGASDDSVLTWTADERAFDALKLLANVQLGSVEIDPIPGEPEHLALAQAQDDDENVGRV